MAYKSHNSPADPGIKKAMMQGHTLSATANYSGSTPQGDKFNTEGGMKVTKDNGANAMSYGKRKVSSSPMMRPNTARKSWRSTGQYSRANRSG